jgi:hypothetical protein
MTELEIILTCITIVSILLTAATFLYARTAISKLLYVSGELGDLKLMIESFSNHVEQVYNLEMYYGDETLEHLVEHSRSFNEQLSTFEFIYSLTEEEFLEDEEAEEGTEEIERDEAQQAQN